MNDNAGGGRRVLSRIELRGMLPRVFEHERIPDSQIWRSDVTLERGGRYMIEAASGGGKSSLCAYIYGSRTDYLGTLLFDGTDARGLDTAAWQSLRRLNIAYLPQELSLFPELTAMQNICLKASLTDAADTGRIEEWLHMLGIDSRAHSPVGRMSIGQQQRVAIIRAVSQPFDFILLDEPVSHLDDDNNRAAAGIIAAEADRYGAAVVVTSVGNRLLLDGMRTLRL